MKSLILTLILISSSAHSASFTGNDLKQSCKHYGKLNWDSGFCIGMVRGAIDGLAFLYSSKICIPAGVTTDQVVLMFKKSLKDYPELLNQDYFLILTATLQRTFPCKASSKKGRVKS